MPEGFGDDTEAVISVLRGYSVLLVSVPTTTTPSGVPEVWGRGECVVGSFLPVSGSTVDHPEGPRRGGTFSVLSLLSSPLTSFDGGDPSLIRVGRPREIAPEALGLSDGTRRMDRNETRLGSCALKHTVRSSDRGSCPPDGTPSPTSSSPPSVGTQTGRNSVYVAGGTPGLKSSGVSFSLI